MSEQDRALSVRCVFCGATGLRGQEGELVWVVTLSTPICDGHETIKGEK